MIGVAILIGTAITVTLAINFYMVWVTQQRVMKPETLHVRPGDYDCIIVLGAAVWGTEPSTMLKDRLDVAIDLYKKGDAPKLLMSGDNLEKEHREVRVMKEYALRHGVPSEDIFMDHSGLSTYDSMRRAVDVFQVKKAIVVTQEYHLYRSVFLADSVGLDTIGVASDPRTYSKQAQYDFRETFARLKAFVYALQQPKSYAGEQPFPISGNGDDTNKN